MQDKVLVREALDTSEERLQTRPRPLYGISYTPLTITEQETGYIRRLIELADGLPFGIPIWQDRVKLTADVAAGASILAVESTDNSLWDTFDELAIIWRSFDDWEIVSVDSVSTNAVTLDAELTENWETADDEGKPAWVIPVAFGHLKRNEATNLTSDHAKISVDFEDRYFPVDVTARPAHGTSTCCQTSGSYFAPAYSIESDRIGVGHRGFGSVSVSGAIIRVLSPECSGVGDIEDTRITGGGWWLGASDRFFFGCQGGSGGAAGDELVAVVQVDTLAVHYIGGFPNPTGVAKGMNSAYVTTSGALWLQLKGCGSANAFAILDTIAETYSLLADSVLATCLDNQFAYVIDVDAIYCACDGGVLARVDVNTLAVTTIDLSELGTVSELLAITYVGTFGGHDGSGKLWISYRSGSVYGIALIDPSSNTIEGGFPTDTGFTILWYAGAYEFVLAQDSTDTLTVYNTDTTADVQQIDGYRMTAQGCYVDSNAKLVIPTYTGGEYCLTYFSPTDSGLSSDGPFSMITETGSPMILETLDRMITEGP